MSVDVEECKWKKKKKKLPHFVLESITVLHDLDLRHLARKSVKGSALHLYLHQGAAVQRAELSRPPRGARRRWRRNRKYVSRFSLLHLHLRRVELLRRQLGPRLIAEDV